jgi:uncharacterized membrane protein
VSAVILHVSHQLASVEGYTSFCNVSSTVNCDVVLGSTWSTFLGLSVAVWAIGVFALGALLALPGAMGATVVGFADLVLIGLVSGSLGFSLVLAGISWLKLHTACLLCMTLYAVIAAWFVTVAPLARRFQLSDRAPWLQRRTARTPPWWWDSSSRHRRRDRRRGPCACQRRLRRRRAGGGPEDATCTQAPVVSASGRSARHAREGSRTRGHDRRVLGLPRVSRLRPRSVTC